MGRKPKALKDEGASSPPLTNTAVESTKDIECTSEPEVVTTDGFMESTPNSGTDTIETLHFDTTDTVITTETVTVPSLNVTIFSTTDKVSIAYTSIEPIIIQEMQWALNEINRCNDYIYAKADLDRRFITYRDELYEYRYKMRQLSLYDKYPYLNADKVMPKRPDYVADV